MSGIELESRPVALFKVVERALGNSKPSNLLRLEFCVYKPHERHEKAHQIIVQVPALELRSEFSRLLTELRPGYEIGLTSRVTLPGNPDVMMHLPMIDFKGMDIEAIPEIEKAILAEVPTIRGLSWFSSGRSLHAYGHSLVNQTSWMLLMGGLLLIDGDVERLSPDPRWVGHRIQDGFGCLRWTNKSNHYAAAPTPLRLEVANGINMVAPLPAVWH